MKTGIICAVLMATCLFGCRSGDSTGLQFSQTEETRKKIIATIAEPARRTAMLEIVDRFEVEIQHIKQDSLELRRKIVDANRDYDTRREDLEALYGQLGGQLDRLGASAKKNSLALRKHCSRSEWKQIADRGKSSVQFTF